MWSLGRSSRLRVWWLVVRRYYYRLFFICLNHHCRPCKFVHNKLFTLVKSFVCLFPRILSAATGDWQSLWQCQGCCWCVCSFVLLMVFRSAIYILVTFWACISEVQVLAVGIQVDLDLFSSSPPGPIDKELTCTHVYTLYNIYIIKSW